MKVNASKILIFEGDGLSQGSTNLDGEEQDIVNEHLYVMISKDGNGKAKAESSYTEELNERCTESSSEWEEFECGVHKLG